MLVCEGPDASSSTSRPFLGTGVLVCEGPDASSGLSAIFVTGSSEFASGLPATFVTPRRLQTLGIGETDLARRKDFSVDGSARSFFHCNVDS